MANDDVLRVYGVDFSGGQSAGKKIWLASGVVQDGELFVEGCFPAKELPDSGRAREACLPALRSFISRSQRTAFGIDFPFGLPADLSPDSDSWVEFLEAFPDRFTGPLDFHEEGKALAGEILDDGVYLKRQTDRHADAPFCPYDWRLKYQTYHGIADLLRPLVLEERVRVLPMQAQNGSKPSLLEICPSSTLDDLDLPRTKYKDTGRAAEEVRKTILDGLEQHGVKFPNAVRQLAVEDSEGDAVDSLVAALATYRAVRDRSTTTDPNIEGHIFV